jgi:hypothetical protein
LRGHFLLRPQRQLGTQNQTGEFKNGRLAPVRGPAMTRRGELIQPMTLGNMRQNGVRGLYVTTRGIPVPSFGPRMRCSCCSSLGATAIPNWIERHNSLPGTRR